MTRQLEWIHPSVRDTVIEYLMDHESDRGAFLKSASVSGLSMSMSLAGGAQGGRVFPLLRTGGDWALLREALVRHGSGLTPHAVVTLATTLREALNADGISHEQRQDLHESVVVFLRAVVAGSDNHAKKPTSEGLRAFYDLSYAVGVFVPSPTLDGLWQDTVTSLNTAISQDLDVTALGVAARFPNLVGLLEISEPRFVRINLDGDILEGLETQLVAVLEPKVGEFEDLDPTEDVINDEDGFIPVEPDGSEGEELRWLSAAESFLDRWSAHLRPTGAFDSISESVEEHSRTRRSRSDRFEEWDAGRQQDDQEPEGFSDDERPFDLAEFFADL